MSPKKTKMKSMPPHPQSYARDIEDKALDASCQSSPRSHTERSVGVRGKFFLIAFLFFFLSLPYFSLAGNFNYQPMEKIPGFETTADIGNFYVYISVIYKFGIWAVGIAALLMITIGGFMYITSAGNNASMEKAKGVITDAIVGLLLALTSWLILYTIDPALVTISPLAPTSVTVSPPFLPATRIGTGKCDPLLSGACSVVNLRTSSCFNTEYLAKKASGICGIESGGNAAFPIGPTTDKCKDGRPFSFGLFQINLIVHGAKISGCEPNKIFNIYNASAGQLQGGCAAPYVTNSSGVKYCPMRDCEVKKTPEALALYTSCSNQLKNAQLNIQLACKVSSDGANWQPWSISNSKCGF